MRQGTITPILAITLAVLAFGAVAYFAITLRMGTETTNSTNGNPNVVTNTNVSVNTNTTVDATKDWLTYTSEKGWSIQYPPNYRQSITSGFAFPSAVVKIADTANGDNSLDPNYIYHTVTVEEYPNDESNRATYAWQTAGFPEPFPAGFTDKVKVQLGNAEATRFQVNYTDQTVYVYYVGGSTTMWQIRDTRIGSGGQQNEHIIKTFMFIGLTSESKLYKNTKDGYSLEYPKGWTVDENRSNDPRNAPLIYYRPSKQVYAQVYAADGDITIQFRLVTNVSEELRSWFAKNHELTAVKIQETMVLVREGKTDVGPGYESQTYSNQTTTIDGQETIIQTIKANQPEYIEGPATIRNEYFIKNGDKVYWILASTPTGNKSTGLINTFQQMMLTFTFTQ